eukprot:TRINITY_DN33892_c0_g2_i1.p1 TRINITY_DN33892_c0_g2~~TRINITY_DN33892_c0_g2_i1.p1  ORF type:complete len:706 (-),score=141.73 TRINITY_DN33892_c0_g2_i1:40-2097(-)
MVSSVDRDAAAVEGAKELGPASSGRLVVRMLRIAGSEELLSALDSEPRDELKTALAELEAALESISCNGTESYDEETEDGKRCFGAICMVAGRLASLASVGAELTDPVLSEAVREGVIALAEMLPAEGLSGCASQEMVATQASAALEAVGEHLDELVVHLFVTLSRIQDALDCAEAGGEARGGGFSRFRTAAITELRRRQNSARGVALWATVLLARVTGYGHMSGRVLWEWCSGDPFCVMMLVKDWLLPQEGEVCEGVVGIPTPPVPPLPASMFPADAEELRVAVRSAVMELARADVAFMFAQGLEDDAEDIVRRSQALLTHRALLASAVVECGAVEALVYQLDQPIVGGGDTLGPAAAAFMAALSHPDAALGPVPSREIGPMRVLGGLLSRHAAQMWSSLGAIPARCELRGVRLRRFLRDCADLAQAAPSSADHIQSFIEACLSQVTGLSASAAANESGTAGSLTALAVCAATCGLVPRGDVLADAMVLAAPEVKAKVIGELRSWKGTVRADSLMPWWGLVNVAEPMRDSSDEEEESFFHSIRSAARDGTLRPPPPPLPPVSPVPVPPPPPSEPSRDTGGGKCLAASGVSCSSLGFRELLREAPPELCCQLDGKLLVDPVRLPQGQVVERGVLERSLAESGGLCPFTGQPLQLVDCPRDREARLRAVRWVRASRGNRSGGKDGH